MRTKIITVFLLIKPAAIIRGRRLFFFECNKDELIITRICLIKAVNLSYLITLGHEIGKYCTVKARLKCSPPHNLLCMQTTVCTDKPKVKEVDLIH